MVCPEETEPVRTDRVNNQAGEKVPAVRAVKLPAPRAGVADAAAAEPAKARAAAVAADRDRVAVRVVEAARTANPNALINNEGGTPSCHDLTEADLWESAP